MTDHSSCLIDLSDDTLFIAKGAFCRCYRHPENPAACIKLPTSESRAAKRLRADRSYHHKLVKRGTDRSHISDYLGPCDTTLGEGHLFELICDTDGTVSQTLAQRLEKSPEDHRQLLTCLKELGKYLEKNHILISDLHERNILIQHLDEGTLKPVIIDGLGDRVAIPILNYFPALAASKLARRWNRFIRNLLKTYPELDTSSEELFLSEKK